MKIFTSRYFNPALKDFKGNLVAISRGLPKATLPYKLAGHMIELAPSKETFAITQYAQYRASYMAQLKDLGYASVIAGISRYAEFGNVVLLCFEDIRSPGEWCHRTMLGEWLRANGQFVMEMEAPVLSDMFIS